MLSSPANLPMHRQIPFRRSPFITTPTFVIPNLPFAIMPSQQITVYPIGSCVLAHYRHKIIHGLIEENGHDRTTGKKARLYVRLLKDFCEFNLLTTKVVLRGVCSESNELVLTKEYVTIAVEDIITPLFIFKKQLIEEQGLVLQGITNAYLIRYTSEGLHIPSHINFLSEKAPSLTDRFPLLPLPKRLWLQIQEVRASLLRMLSRQSRHQLWRHSERVTLSSEFSQYLKTNIAHTKGSLYLEKILHPTTYRYKSKQLIDKCRRVSFYMKQAGELLRFETHDDLAVFRSLFGIHSTIGVCEHWPTLKNSHVALHLLENTRLNTIDGCTEAERPTKFFKFPSNVGIDLNFCPSLQKCDIRVRYTRILYQPGNGADMPLHLASILNLTRATIAAQADNADVASGDVMLGSHMNDGGNEYVIRFVDPNKQYVLAEHLMNPDDVEDDVEATNSGELERIDYYVAAVEVMNYYDLN